MVKTSLTITADMSEILFVTRLYKARIAPSPVLGKTCLGIATEDRAGQSWSRQHGYAGYTSYASLDDLTRRASEIDQLEKKISHHVSCFAREAQFDLGGRKLVLDSLWINVMNKNAHHEAHVHPHSVISGTYYVSVPVGAGSIRFEDPRLCMMMAAPPRKSNARADNRLFFDIHPKNGMLLLWESWLRHGVKANASRQPRISLSFNYSAV